MESTVKRVLEHRGMRQDWLAQRLGISYGYLSKLLSGDKPWTAELKEKTAFWLGVPEDMLFFGPECAQKEQELTPEAATHD